MNKIPFRLLICLIVLCGLLAGFSSTALAAPSLHWQTDQVYYDNDGRLIIEGYFYNNGTRTITWINWQAVKVYFRQQNTGWWLQAAATFNDLNVTLYPGDSIHWTFRITNASLVYFDYWNVKWDANYQYK
ncbi:MAG: hypothetical protein PHQ46_02320 [Negativicutes bacterium]|nr:hypothetical protein [Negativicutes bacterium]